MKKTLLIFLFVLLSKPCLIIAQDSDQQRDSINVIVGVYSAQRPVLLEKETVLEQDTIELISTGTKSTWRAWEKERRSILEEERQKAVHRRLANRIAVFYSTLSELRIEMREKGEELNINNVHSWEPTMMAEVMISDNIAKERTIYAVEGNMGLIARGPLPELQWSMTSEASVIQGLKCEKAQTELNNRKWTVWYTAEVPVLDGPSVFKGLPGFVVKVEDSEGLYKYELIGLKEGRVATSTFEVPIIEKVMELSEKKYAEYEAAKLMHRMAYTIGADGTVYYIKSPVLYSIHP